MEESAKQKNAVQRNERQIKSCLESAKARSIFFMQNGKNLKGRELEERAEKMESKSERGAKGAEKR